MNKADVVEKLTERLGDKKVAEAALDGLLDVINRAVAKGEKVSITGFGTFEKVDRPARVGRNPQTGAKVKIKKTSVPKFRAGANFKGVANGSVKMGREPKHEPLLPAGVTSARSLKALAEAAPVAAPAKKAAPAAKKAAPVKTAAKKATPVKAAPAKAAAAKKAPGPAKKTVTRKVAVKAPAKKAAPAKTAAKKAPAKKTAVKRTAKKS